MKKYLTLGDPLILHRLRADQAGELRTAFAVRTRIGRPNALLVGEWVVKQMRSAANNKCDLIEKLIATFSNAYLISTDRKNANLKKLKGE